MPASEKLHVLARYQINFFRRHPNFGRLYLRSSAIVLGDVETRIDQLVSGRYAEAMKLQCEMFRAGQRDGTFKPGDPLVLARLFSAMVSAFQGVDLDVTTPDEPTHAPMTVEQFLEYVDGAFRA